MCSHAIAAGTLLDLLERKEATGFIAWHSVSNLYYLVSSKRGQQDTRSFFRELMELIEIAPTSTECLRLPTQLKMKNFEDAMQVVAALACGADVIATRNVHDYAKAPIDIAAPASVLKSIGG